MGFLNHATNNIIIDAVLTERGRELLSRNDGSFNVAAFAFGDDEVDYSIIKKYGLTIGKEKIEKNTPVFEANPNENISIKHPLISFPNPLTRILEIPTLIRDDDVNNSAIQMFDTRSLENSATDIVQSVVVKNSINSTGISILDDNITDSRFLVKMHGSLLKMQNGTFIDTDLNNVDTYEISTDIASNPAWDNQISAIISFYSIGVVSSSSFEEFSTISNANKINTSIQVIGESSGANIVIPVTITKRTTNVA